MCFYSTSWDAWCGILQKCQILVFCTHSCSGLSTPNLVCFYNTSWHTQSGVYRILWPEWQILECSTHSLWCVLYTRCRSANWLCMLQTLLQWILHTRYLHKMQCAMHLKITFKHKQPMIGHARSTYSNILPVFSSVCITSEKNEVKA